MYRYQPPAPPPRAEIPEELLHDKSYVSVWEGLVEYRGPRAHHRIFHSYLELTMQAKHDANIKTYCSSQNLYPRCDRSTPCEYEGNVATALRKNGFYHIRGKTAANAVAQYMRDQWDNKKTISVGARLDCSIQIDIQSDGYHYEVSLYKIEPPHNGVGEVFVLFHCYPQRKKTVSFFGAVLPPYWGRTLKL